MKKKVLKLPRKGFTLIELLAVLIILAIIALIAVSTITNIVEKTNKSAFKDSAYGVIKAGELYYSNQLLLQDEITEDIMFTFPDHLTGLEIKGSRPTGGTMIVKRDGKVGMAINNGKYCVKKGYDDDDIVIGEKLDDCFVPSIMTSTSTCIKDVNSICPSGTLVKVQVNVEDAYNFYVIEDSGNELTLLMDRNLGSKVVWVSSADYIASGGTLENYTANNISRGPLTALVALEERTSDWINIPTMSYTLNDDGGNAKYLPISKTNVRARMLTKTEIQKLGCSQGTSSCPAYVYINTSTGNTNTQHWGYWLSSATGVSNNFTDGLTVDCIGRQYMDVVSKGAYGVRPVIKLSKTL